MDARSANVRVFFELNGSILTIYRIYRFIEIYRIKIYRIHP